MMWLERPNERAPPLRLVQIFILCFRVDARYKQWLSPELYFIGRANGVFYEPFALNPSPELYFM